MIYTAALILLGVSTALWLAATVTRAGRRRQHPVGFIGVVAWVAGEALLALGVGTFVAVGRAHPDGADVGAVWVVAAFLLAVVTWEGGVRPRAAARHIAGGAALLIGATALLTVITFAADRSEFDRTTFGPFVESVVFVAVPALVASAFLRLSVPREAATSSSAS